jgi:hypothetical protein
MNAELVPRVAREEAEFARKRWELAQIRIVLADRELFLANLRAEFAAFERRYLREIGTLYAELDDWSDKLADWLSKNLDAGSDEYGEWDAKIAELAGEEQRQRESRPASGRRAARVHPAVDEDEHAEDFRPSSRLKSLYREVAKRVHPDLATDEADRHKRELLMKEANDAYQRGDQEALRRILEDYENSPESVQGRGIAADLVRVTRQIKQVNTRLLQIERDITAVMNSSVGKLKSNADEAFAEGRDLLAEMAADLRRRIAIKRRDLAARTVVKQNA